MLIFDKSSKGRHGSYIPACDVPVIKISDNNARHLPLNLPELSENDISRHYTFLEGRAHGVNNGFYPLGSCTMKYNPKINEVTASLDAFVNAHPLAPETSVQGCLQIMYELSNDLCEIAGMDKFTLQPAAGAHGEFTGLLLIKKYHLSRGDLKRTKIIVPDSAHGTNPASAVMAGFTVVNIPSTADGCVDLDALGAALDDSVAGLMLTNPNTLGLFDTNIDKITAMVHEAGGLCYYDGANLNAIMGTVRPGDMGFDCVHLNLHKTFSTPHGGGGPGSGPVGCKAFLADYLPGYLIEKDGISYKKIKPSQSIGRVKAFYGNFLVLVRAYTYIKTLGKEGIPQASKHAVLNARYMAAVLGDTYDIAVKAPCMHEFVLSLQRLKDDTGVSALDIAKGLLDNGIHPPTMYFPLIVHEALMIEPCETESKEVMDEAAEVLKSLYKTAHEDSGQLHTAPHTTPVSRLDEVEAARHPVLKWEPKE